MRHIFGIKSAAIVEGYTFTQVETPCATAHVFPLGRKARLKALTGHHFGNRLGNVLQNDATDVGPRGHARINQVKLFRQYDSDRVILRHGGQSHDHRERCSLKTSF